LGERPDSMALLHMHDSQQAPPLTTVLDG
jgi:hypothetical protein